MVAGCQVHSSDIDKGKNKILFVIVSLLGAVGVEVLGQVVACGWLGDGGGRFQWRVVGKGAGGCGGCKGNLTVLRRILSLDLAKGNPK
jgi:hypothetical protein